MKVILRDDMEKLGIAGDVVAVRDGFARNYLIPMRLAIPATKGNLSAVGEVKRQKSLRDMKAKRAAESHKARIEAISLSAEVLVGGNDRVFGSVTARTVADLAKAQGFTIDRRKLDLEQPLKALGVYDVPVKLHPEVTAHLKVWVVRQKGPVDPEVLARLEAEAAAEDAAKADVQPTGDASVSS